MIRFAKNPVVPAVLAAAIFAMTSCYIDAEVDVAADDPHSRRSHVGVRGVDSSRIDARHHTARSDAGRARAYIGPMPPHASPSMSHSTARRASAPRAVGSHADAAEGSAGTGAHLAAECTAPPIPD